ncbi:MAG: deoxyribodipyrimidine photo-lyase [Planctomycetota bacterium]
MSNLQRSLVWFRRDLRVCDNSALAHACQLEHDIVGLFVITAQQWQEHDDSDHKISFTLGCLRELSDQLSELNIPLVIEFCDRFEDVPDLLTQWCRQHQISSVFVNREYEVNELNRDRDVRSALGEIDVDLRSFHDRVIVPPRDIETKQGNFYSVFTPYRKNWDARVEAARTKSDNSKDHNYVQVHDQPAKRTKRPKVACSNVPDSVKGFETTSCWQDQFPAGETAAQEKLTRFSHRIAEYKNQRDLPSVNGTSGLSPYLAAGAISPRQCLQLAHRVTQEVGPNEGTTIWVSELAWRDFYVHVLTGFPRVSKHLPFRMATNQLDWRADDDDFNAWCNGMTGFPIVDAGMRQLNQTGWMHNRLRMIVAMFLTKNLLIDWRLGERYFMKKLIDGDLAANNGGWQWSASTGTDAVPYFRIFSPFSQSKRFDSEGTFIKKMCPELSEVPAPALHDQKKLAKEIEKREIDYPAFIVDYKFSRERALAAFKSI